ncbi:adenylate cyclase [Dehalobacterium formicoaceticum]|uniref:adenylate cyclase n=1 Tax=Dehalobacterium formicoaceticum TaxID=51515 RepID=UPI000B7DE57C|nr:adenylate cyclase [Dehalobacterium formicoaceticum]
MSFTIQSKTDVFKFALPLVDYLNQHGYEEEAKDLGNLVDSCFPEDEQALEAHRKAFRLIQEKVVDLPPAYRKALEDALEIIS